MTKKEAIAAKVNKYATCKGRIVKLSVIANNEAEPQYRRNKASRLILMLYLQSISARASAYTIAAQPEIKFQPGGIFNDPTQ